MSDIALLFKAKKNQVLMIRDRGYDVGDEINLIDYTLDEFTSVYVPYAKSNGQTLEGVLGSIYSYPEGYQGEDTGPTWVHWLEPPKGQHVGKNQITPLVEALLSPDYATIKKLLLIIPVGLSSAAKAVLAELSSYQIEVFPIQDLTFRPIDNYLVPKHVLLTSAERAETFKDQDLTKLPLISVSDPIARYYGAVPGQVFKIYRKDLTGSSLVSESIFYRVVINRPLTTKESK